MNLIFDLLIVYMMNHYNAPHIHYTTCKIEICSFQKESKDTSNVTKQEANDLNSVYKDKRKDFDFMNKKVGFLLNYIKISKEKYFENRIDNNLNKGLILLTQKEKNKYGGYDVIVTLKRKEGLIKQIANRRSLLKKYRNE